MHAEHLRVNVDTIPRRVNVKCYFQLSRECLAITLLCPVLRYPLPTNSMMYGNLLVVVMHTYTCRGRQTTTYVARLFMEFAQLVYGHRKFVTTSGLQKLIATYLLIIAVICLLSSSVTKSRVVWFSNAPLLNTCRVALCAC